MHKGVQISIPNANHIWLTKERLNLARIIKHKNQYSITLTFQQMLESAHNQEAEQG